MSKHLSAGQRALLEAALVRRQQQLDTQLASLQQGLSRAEHTRELLQDEGPDAPEREPERRLDMSLSDRGLRELGEVSDALRRLREHEYGLCADCGIEIPFERLRAEPWALRCVDCEQRRERAARLTGA